MADKKVKVFNIEGVEVEEIKLPDFFDTDIKEDVLHTVVKSQMANARHSIANTKTRGKISGGGKKPWRQKGTGRARAGSSRSPLWRGGGITFGPSSERNFSQKVNKKVARAALAMAYSVKLIDSNITVLENVDFGTPKTKIAAALLKKLNLTKTTLVAIASEEEISRLAFRNIPSVNCEKTSSVSVVDLLKYKNLLITKDAIKSLEQIFKKVSQGEISPRETDKQEKIVKAEKAIEEPKEVKKDKLDTVKAEKTEEEVKKPVVKKNTAKKAEKASK